MRIACGVALAALGACGASVVAREQHVELPGALWLVDGDTLVRIDGARRTELRDPAGATLYPSRFALPSGQLVAIASRGDGGPSSEQLALVSTTGTIDRVGQAGTSVRDPAVADAGCALVVAATYDGHSDLYRVDLVTGQTTRITNEPTGNFAPALSGGDLIYVSSRDGDAEIYRGTQRLTAFHRDDWAPVPHGDHIAFQSDREGPSRIFVMARDGTHQRRLTSHPRDAGDELEHVWSPDGTHIAYVLESRGARSVRVHTLATGEDVALTPLGSDHEPAWSPDGEWLAISRGRHADAAVIAIRLADRHEQRISSGRLPRWL
jgi:TolB protein